jgi:hypothetical protein
MLPDRGPATSIKRAVDFQLAGDDSSTSDLYYTPVASFCCNYTPMAYSIRMPSLPLTVVETPQFLRQAEDVWTEAERQDFVDYIARNPEAGDLIPETGGIRKVRWRRQGMGKRGGARVIYFYYDLATPLFLLMVYAKAVREGRGTGSEEGIGGICGAHQAGS